MMVCGGKSRAGWKQKQKYTDETILSLDLMEARGVYAYLTLLCSVSTNIVF